MNSCFYRSPITRENKKTQTHVTIFQVGICVSFQNSNCQTSVLDIGISLYQMCAVLFIFRPRNKKARRCGKGIASVCGKQTDRSRCTSIMHKENPGFSRSIFMLRFAGVSMILSRKNHPDHTIKTTCHAFKLRAFFFAAK